MWTCTLLDKSISSGMVVSRATSERVFREDGRRGTGESKC